VGNCPAVRYVAGVAVFGGRVNAFEREYFAGMTAETIVIIRLDAHMRFVTFIAIQPRHGDLVRK
jgi:hypothetical protein